MEPTASTDASRLPFRALESGRVHSAYLISGPADAARELARRFARALVCAGPDRERPCEVCRECRRSAHREEPALDGSGRSGPLFRHIGDHPDLFFVGRGADDTRVRIGQIRALQAALRLGSAEGGRRVAVIADAEWLNSEAQNALLRLLEEPPPATTLLLVAPRPAALLATVRSRCQRVRLPLPRPETAESHPLESRLASLGSLRPDEVLDLALEYRGDRARAAAAVEELLQVAAGWIARRAAEAVRAGEGAVDDEVELHRRLRELRRALRMRNANPQMVAERALFGIRDLLAARAA